MKFRLKTAYTSNINEQPFDNYITDLTNAGLDITTQNNKCYITLDTLGDLQELSRITQNNIIFDGDNNTLTIYDYYME